jgi:hypothetical protein
MFIIDSSINSNILDEYCSIVRQHFREKGKGKRLESLEWSDRNMTLDINDKLVGLIKDIIESKLRVELTCTEFELCSWPKGTESGFHVHDYKPYNVDGKLREPTDYNSILYLNDNFSGGEFITGKSTVDPSYGIPYGDNREDGITIKPKKGRLTFFDGMAVPHGLNKVIGNTRHTALFWWTNTKFY